MLTKGAIGNLVNRYKAVLAKCNLINTFGSLAVASMLVLGGAVMCCPVSAMAESIKETISDTSANWTTFPSSGQAIGYEQVILTNNNGCVFFNKTITIDASQKVSLASTNAHAISYGTYDISAPDISIVANGEGYVDAIYIPSDTSGKINIHGFDKLTMKGDYHAIFNNAQQSNADSLIIKGNAGSEVVLEGKKGYALGNTYYGTTEIIADSLIAISNSPTFSPITNKSSNSLKINVSDLYVENTNETFSGDAIFISDGVVNFDISGVAIVKGNTGVQDNGTLNITVNGDDASFTSGIRTIGDATSNINLRGSTWNVTGASSVTKLDMEDAVVDMSGTDGDITITNLNGEGGEVVMDAAKTNKFNVKTASEDTTVKAVATQNADNVTKAQAAEMVNRLEGVQNKTAEVAGGLGKDGYTVTTDENGKAVVSGGGASDVTKTVLQQASVTTIALDKLLTNDVRKRLGDIRSDKNTTGVWMRWDGGKLKGDAGLANNFNTIQIGGDTKAAKNCRIGFAGSFTHGDMDFNRGGGELEGFSFALYGTWMDDNGMFADVVARLGKFSTEMNVEGNKGDMDNRVASLSAEYGWRFDLAQQFFIEPQVELAYTYVSSDDLQLGDVQYQFDSVDSLTGRAGLVAGWNLPDERGNVYARASVVQQFMGDAKITGYTNADPVVHETDGEDTWLEYGIGANVKLTDNTYVWADVERTEGADIEEEWRGTVGVRFSF